MPYKSKAQRGYFHYLESKGKLPKETVDEWDEASEGKHLPEHVKHPMNEGGYVGHGNRAFGHSSDPVDTFYGGEYPGYPDIKEKIHEKSMGHYADGGRVLDHSNEEGPSEYQNNWPRAKYMNEGGRTFGNDYAPNRGTSDWPRGNLYEVKGMKDGGRVLDHGNEEDKHEYGNNVPYSKYMNRGGVLDHGNGEDRHEYGNNVPYSRTMCGGGYMSQGGQAMGFETFDEDTGNPKHYNSSGEPHTHHKYEEESPEEYEGFGKIPGMKKVRWPGNVHSLEATGRSGHGNRDATSDGPLSTDRAFGKALKKRRLYSTSPG